MKIVTLAAAAEKLGWDFTYETRLFASGPIDGGILHGDLIVVGSGDPSIDDWDGKATQLFADWAEQLKSAGIGRSTAGSSATTTRSTTTASGWAGRGTTSRRASPRASARCSSTKAPCS